MLHDVEITRPFLLGQHEVTQQEWRTVMGTSPSHFGACGPRCPVENVSFDDVQQFLDKLNAPRRSDAAVSAADRGGVGVRVPRPHHRSVFDRREPHDGAGELQRHASRTRSFPAGEFRQKPTPAGDVPAQPVGARRHARQRLGVDVGLVRPVPESGAANIDPHGPAAGEKRVIRGGSWFFDANSARCALRYTHAPQDKGFSLGFRVAADRPR